MLQGVTRVLGTRFARFDPGVADYGDVRELVNPTDCESAKGEIETRTLPHAFADGFSAGTPNAGYQIRFLTNALPPRDAIGIAGTLSMF